MTFVWNQTTANHLTQLEHLFAGSSEVRIICPYLRREVVERLLAKREHGAETRVLTRWSAADFTSGASDLEALGLLLEMGARIRVLRSGVHAKVYIQGRELAIVTSANLTRSGLENNLECGVLVSDPAVGELVNKFEAEWRRGQDIESEDVNLARQEIDRAHGETRRLREELRSRLAEVQKHIRRVLVVHHPDSETLLLELAESQIEFLSRPVTGSGGMQSLLRRLQSNLSDNHLSLTREDCERIVRYHDQYGGGGWQDRLAAVVEAAEGYLR